MSQIQGPAGAGVPAALASISEHMADSITVTTNLHTEVVVTTRDKIANALYRVLPKFKRRTSWVAPATLLSSLVVALLSTDFNQELMGLSAETWKAMFTLAAAAALLWLLWAIGGAIFFSANHQKVVDAIVKTHKTDLKAPIPGVVVGGEPGNRQQP